MDKDLIEFFGRAKRISLTPQDRKNLWEELASEREHVSERHKECMKIPSNIMHTASAIGLSSKEKGDIRNKLLAFMRSNTFEKNEPINYWSLKTFIYMYMPILAVTFIILANAQQWEKGLFFNPQSEQLIPIPYYEGDAVSSEDELGVQDEDQGDTVAIPQPPVDNEVSDTQPNKQNDDLPIFTNPMHIERSYEDDIKTGINIEETYMPQSTENAPDTTQIRSLEYKDDPIYQPKPTFENSMKIERVNREDPQTETKVETAPVTQPTKNVPDTNQMRSTKDTQQTDPTIKSTDDVPDTNQTQPRKSTQQEDSNYQPESTKTTTDSVSEQSSNFTEIIAAEERLESLRLKSKESEKAISLFYQAEQMLNKAYIYPERSSTYIKEAEYLMDQLDDIVYVK